MKTFQVIMKSGLTKNIEAQHALVTPHTIEFRSDGEVIFMFRNETVVRVEAFDDAMHHELTYPPPSGNTQLAVPNLG